MSNDQSQTTAAPAAAAPAAAAPAAPDHAAALKALEAEATDLLHRIGATVTSEDKFATSELTKAKIMLEGFVHWVEAHFKKTAT